MPYRPFEPWFNVVVIVYPSKMGDVNTNVLIVPYLYSAYFFVFYSRDIMRLKLIKKKLRESPRWTIGWIKDRYWNVSIGSFTRIVYNICTKLARGVTGVMAMKITSTVWRLKKKNYRYRSLLRGRAEVHFYTEETVARYRPCPPPTPALFHTHTPSSR